MQPAQSDTGELIDRAKLGDGSAFEQLLTRHRDRLRHMVSVRIDERLSPRVDPSDVVQEAMVVAAMKFEAYLSEPVVPFYPWLRRIAWERLVDLHRRHIRRRKTQRQSRKVSWDCPASRRCGLPISCRQATPVR